MHAKINVVKRRSLPAACKELVRQIKKHPVLYLMLVPAVAYFLIFKYLPMQGILIAFKNFKGTKGIWGSDWVGMKYFNLLFRDAAFWRAFENTIIISLMRLAVGFPFPIILALLLNEFNSKRVRNTVQTIIYLPHFLTWVVIAGLLNNLFAPGGGTINQLMTDMGGQPFTFLTNPKVFRWTLVITNCIKEGGWASIVYMAAIASINTEMYEAAFIDGANRWKQLIYITLPNLAPTLCIMLIMDLGNIMEAGMGQIIVLYNAGVMSVSDIIDTLIYRKSLLNVNYSYGTAAGLLKSVINVVLILSSNKIVKLLGGDGLF